MNKFPRNGNFMTSASLTSKLTSNSRNRLPKKASIRIFYWPLVPNVAFAPRFFIWRHKCLLRTLNFWVKWSIIKQNLNFVFVISWTSEPSYLCCPFSKWVKTEFLLHYDDWKGNFYGTLHQNHECLLSFFNARSSLHSWRNLDIKRGWHGHRRCRFFLEVVRSHFPSLVGK